MFAIILFIAMAFVIVCLYAEAQCFVEAKTSKVRTILCEQEEIVALVKYKGIPPSCTYDESPSRLS